MSQPSANTEPCSEAPASISKQLIDNIPYLAMLLLGASILGSSVSAGVGSWLYPLLYVAYGVGGAVWIMVFVCPYCHFYDTRQCPCGYGEIAARLREKRDPERFAAQFRKHIPVLVPLWFVPPVVGGFGLAADFSWILTGLLAAFVLVSFVILPLVSKKYGCAQCPQKEACPWMGTCRTGS